MDLQKQVYFTRFFWGQKKDTFRNSTAGGYQTRLHVTHDHKFANLEVPSLSFWRWYSEILISHIFRGHFGKMSP